MPALPMEKAEEYLPHLLAAMMRFEINTPLRIAAFLAQLAQESAQLTLWRENLNYSAKALARTWPGRFRGKDGKPNAKALEIAHNPPLIAEAAYGGRLGNGPEGSGDGWRCRGVGPIQTTGVANLREAGRRLGLPLETQPELLELPEHGFMAAGLFWSLRDLNAWADQGQAAFDTITRLVNGPALHAREKRLGYYLVARRVLGVD